MKAIFSGRRILRSLMSTSLLAIAGLAALALGPGLVPTFGSDAELPQFNRPAVPTAVAQAAAVNTNEAIVLANWEFTSKNPYGDATKDVAQALSQVNEANLDAAQVLLGRSKHADPVSDVLKAYNLLAEAAGDARSLALSADASAMLNVYIKLYNDAKAGNATAVFNDTVAAQAIANKAVLDASPYK